MLKSFPRQSGVLMHVTSLPGYDGIGTLGKSACAFIDFLKASGCHWWQILPLGPVDAFFSPYKSLSAFAGNTLLIDPDLLYAQGLLTKAERESALSDNPYYCEYESVQTNRQQLYHQAYARISSSLREAVEDYKIQNSQWLDDYALLKAIESDTGKHWMDFEPSLKHRDPSALKEARSFYQSEMDYYAFLEYLFESQWQAVKAYANESGIQILGDMPIYLSLESADVWANQHLFDLDDTGQPKAVAGVPPDYFCADGQLWGNPLYNWKAMKQENYNWWIGRLRRQFDLYDAVRIDHFRAFSAYWAVPASASTAKEGKWLKGPGMDFLSTVFDAFDTYPSRILAEDLGMIDTDVIKLLQESGLPGMRVMEFGFIEGNNSIHLPHNYTQNCVAYTGTHDNNTLFGFLWELHPSQRDFAFDYIGFQNQNDAWQIGGPESPVCHSFIRTLFQSSANLVIVPIQDLLGYGADTRMNQPGTASGNWSFRLSPEAFSALDENLLRHFNTLYGR